MNDPKPPECLLKLLPICPTPPPESSSTAYYYTSPEGRQIYPDTSSLTPYKPLPEGWDKSEHYWLYGWPAGDRKLQSLLPQYFGIRPEFRRPAWIDAGKAASRLEFWSGYEHLVWLICKPTEETQEEGVVEDIDDDGLGVPFLMMSCTASSRLFTQRPTVKQLRFLTWILGEPRWLEARYLKKDFPSDLMG